MRSLTTKHSTRVHSKLNILAENSSLRKMLTSTFLVFLTSKAGWLNITSTYMVEQSSLSVGQITEVEKDGEAIRKNLASIVANLQLPENSLISWWQVLTDGELTEARQGLIIKPAQNLKEKLDTSGVHTLPGFALFADGRIRWVKPYQHDGQRELVWTEIPPEYYPDIAIPAFEAIKKHLEKNQTHPRILSVVGRIIEHLSRAQK